MRVFGIYWKVGDKARRFTVSQMAALGQDYDAEMRRILIEDLVEHCVLDYEITEVFPDETTDETTDL